MSVKIRMNNRQFRLTWEEFEKLMLRREPGQAVIIVAVE